MEIKLNLKQVDIENAIREYVANNGIDAPVRTINFKVNRKGGFALSAEIEVDEHSAPAVEPTPENPSEPVDTQEQSDDVVADSDDTAGTPDQEETAAPETEAESANDGDNEPATQTGRLFSQQK